MISKTVKFINLTLKLWNLKKKYIKKVVILLDFDFFFSVQFWESKNFKLEKKSSKIVRFQKFVFKKSNMWTCHGC